MESIKHKMDTMVKEKDAAIEKAMGFEAETEELNKVCKRPYRHLHTQFKLYCVIEFAGPIFIYNWPQFVR